MFSASLITPTFNEAKSLPSLIDEIFLSIDKAEIDLELIIVDDNSPDGTARVAEELAQSGKFKIKIIKREKKLGLGGAVCAGFAASTRPILGIMDGDGSHDPSILNKLILSLKEKENDLAIGSRFLKNSKVENWSKSRKILSQVGVWLAKCVLKPKIKLIKNNLENNNFINKNINKNLVTDPLSGYFFLRQEVLTGVKLKTTGYKLLFEILVKGNYKKISELPFCFRARQFSKSKLNWVEYLRFGWQIKYYFWLLRLNLGQNLLALVLYSSLFVFFTWPLAHHFREGILGWYGSDSPIYLWNAWEWGRKISAGDFGFSARDIFFPYAPSMLMHTATMTHAFLALGLNIFIKNLIASYNLVFFCSSVAGAYFAYLFFKLKFNNYSAALLAGQYFGFQQLAMIYTLFGTQNLLAFWYIPATLYFFERFRLSLNFKWSIWLGLILGLAFLNDYIIFILTVFGLGLYGLTCLFFYSNWRKKILVLILGIILAFAVVAGWKVSYMATHSAEVGAAYIPSVDAVDAYYSDPMNLLRPTKFSRYFGTLATLYSPKSLVNGNSFIGFAFLIILLLFISARFKTKNKLAKEFWAWLAMYLLVIIISLGPYLHFFGHTLKIYLPYYWLYKIYPEWNNFRVPARWNFLAVIFFTGVFGYLVNYLLNNFKLINQKIKWQAIFAFLIFVSLILEARMIPGDILYVYGARAPSVFTKIKADSRLGSVLELPLALTSGYEMLGEGARVNMLHQIVHERSIVGGHLSRLPDNFLDKYKTEPVISYLLNFKNVLPSKIDTASTTVNIFLNKYQPRFIVIDKILYPEYDSANTSSVILTKYITSTLGFQPYFEDANNATFVNNK